MEKDATALVQDHIGIVEDPCQPLPLAVTTAGCKASVVPLQNDNVESNAEGHV